MSKSNMFLSTGKILGYISGCLFLLLNLSAPPSLAMEPEKILSLSLQAQFQVNIEGIMETQVYHQERNYTIRAKVVYQEPDFSYILYLAPPMVKGKKILDNGKLRIEYTPGMNDFKISASLNSPLARKRLEKGLNLIFANHTISQSPDEEIAGRGVYVVSLLLRPSGNPGLKIWIDKETFLPLKRERHSSEGKLTFSFQFLEIHFNKKLSREELNDIPKSVKDNGFRPPYRVIGDIEELKETSRFSLSFPKYLPSGYSFREGVLFNGGQRVDLIYANGLEIIVLSQSLPIDGKTEHSGQVPFTGALLIIGAKTEVWTSEGKIFVLMADLSEEELDKIMESIE